MAETRVEERSGLWVVGIALLAGCVFFLTWTWHWTTTRPTLATEYTNPVLNTDFPEPSILAARGEFFAYAAGAKGINIQMARSPDLVQWTVSGDALPALGAWAEPGAARAPRVVTGPRRGYVMYYTARERGGGRPCIGAATSQEPAGPFIDPAEHPLVCQPDAGSIDPYPFADEDGSRYLLWTDEGNCCGASAVIRAQLLGKDALSLVGAPVELLRADQPWEGGVIEAPTLVKRAGRYVLFYSGSDASFDSAVGYATASSPLGPFVKASANPLLKSQGDICRPGSQVVVLDAVGQDWLFYNAWQCGVEGYPAGRRALYADPLSWENDRPSLPSTLAGPEPAPHVHR